MSDACRSMWWRILRAPAAALVLALLLSTAALLARSHLAARQQQSESRLAAARQQSVELGEWEELQGRGAVDGRLESMAPLLRPGSAGVVMVEWRALPASPAGPIEVQSASVELALLHERALLDYLDAMRRQPGGIVWLDHCALWAKPVTAGGVRLPLRARCQVSRMTVRMGDPEGARL